ncbi:hypothetical protein BX616_007827 [Lobosporangium transversale]|uniref:Uncharacterized protein n=1 Tax=Lobosporangium transversale TaxID=64571 RepID=A0A1Y2GF56_9FUNG|nr:hypothetical protein BCR41DRAFT_398979 [Lobosporangium transversale]KAF9914663.1 hypothetical protein BX616_007827 [Lobosporangium transversale]ORZ09109.1 hypothetical protein BCR41DRAFT_398979 [Lobosporangium transversale]|eukprot:XP_021878736.1 hypothetical protein BCR41DRAFT_398979 [Lobosporangium transversale]
MPSFLKRFATISHGSGQSKKDRINKKANSNHKNASSSNVLSIALGHHPRRQTHTGTCGTSSAHELDQELVKRNSSMSTDSSVSSSSYTSSPSNVSTAMTSNSSLPFDLKNSSSQENTYCYHQQQQISTTSTNAVEPPKKKTPTNHNQQEPSHSLPSTSTTLSSSHSFQQTPNIPIPSSGSRHDRAASESLEDGEQRQKSGSLSLTLDPRASSMPTLQHSSTSHSTSLRDQHHQPIQPSPYHSAAFTPIVTNVTTASSPMSSLSPTSGLRLSNIRGGSVEQRSRPLSEHFNLDPPPRATLKKSQTLSSKKKIVNKSLPSFLPQHEQQQEQEQQEEVHEQSLYGSGTINPRLAYQPKIGRWGSKSGVGINEMMIDLETAGVFVPSNGQRLRAEFVYRTVIQCADEIRRRGLDHENILLNPSPKKVILSMIALMTDQERCDLYSIQCLRIDTVAGLMLNLLSQMSNPVIPYAVMEHYFKQGGYSTTRSPALEAVISNAKTPILPVSKASTTLRSRHRKSLSVPAMISTRTAESSTATASTVTPDSSEGSAPVPSSSPRSPASIDVLLSLPAIPALPPKGSPQATNVAWAREHFDLAMFLAVLPEMNRVILLEVLHLCQELLDHQLWNHLTISRLVQQISPALFSTVFDRRILESMAGGPVSCSIHGETISSEEGARAESHLFMVILVRFLHLTAGANAVNPLMNNINLTVSGAEGVYGPNGAGITFRKSQERLMEDQQEYHKRMAHAYHQMEIQKQPSQHFGVYSASQKQQQQKERSGSNLSLPANPQDIIAGSSAAGTTTMLSPCQSLSEIMMPEASSSLRKKASQHDHFKPIRSHPLGKAIAA